MAEPKPFKLHVADADLDFLRRKLELARLPDQPVGFDIQQGVPVADMHRLISHWLASYLPNWRQHEAKLNQVPQFTTTIKTDDFGELELHFVHQRSEVKQAIPLLFVHGWPGSFIEVLKLLPLLTKGNSDAPCFHVVAPSLPNYGFSEGVPKVQSSLANRLIMD
jgi:Epoxide hydrolase N terminus